MIIKMSVVSLMSLEKTIFFSVFFATIPPEIA